MSDHPLIEKLPKEVHGIQVREVLIQFFRNHAHGAPDNITKDGCVQLARLSNQLGESQQKGHVLWNEWRKAFPVKEDIPAVYDDDERGIYLQRYRFQNITDFSNFKSKNSKGFIDHFFSSFSFVRFQFGDFARFDEAEFVTIICDYACWGKGSTFFATSFGGNASFKYCKWGDHCRFDGAVWEQQAFFQNASIGRGSVFIGSRWGDFPDFSEASIGDNADFSDSHFGWEAKFTNAKFGRDLCFARVNFNDVDFTATNHSIEGMQSSVDSSLLNSSNKDNESKFILHNIDFGGCRFDGLTDFHGRIFSGNINFGFARKHAVDLPPFAIPLISWKSRLRLI